MANGTATPEASAANAVITEVYRPVRVGTFPGASRLRMAGTNTLATAIAAASRTVPVHRLTGMLGIERSAVPRASAIMATNTALSMPSLRESR